MASRTLVDASLKTNSPWVDMDAPVYVCVIIFLTGQSEK